jgi:uncharacterized membrane protein (UPF0127 family)
MNKKIILILLALLSTVGICSTVKISSANRVNYDIVGVTLVSQQGSFAIEAEVADSPIKISRGLMRRRRLPKNAGMLFIFEDEVVRSFWMKNTLIPLDIIFVSKNLKIVHIAQYATPCKRSPCEKYDSIYPAKYVVEINGGLSEEMGLVPGDYIEMDL